MGRGHQLGRFVLVADKRAGASIAERTVAIALSDQLGAVLALEVRHPLEGRGLDDDA